MTVSVWETRHRLWGERLKRLLEHEDEEVARLAAGLGVAGSVQGQRAGAVPSRWTPARQRPIRAVDQAWGLGRGLQLSGSTAPVSRRYLVSMPYETFLFIDRSVALSYSISLARSVRRLYPHVPPALPSR